MDKLDNTANIRRIGNEIEQVLRGEVTLWFWKYREEEVLLLQDISATFLNLEEQLRLGKMVSVGRRADYLAGRWLVKKVKEVGHNYSLSHSEGVVVLATAKGYLGVDIESQSKKKQRKYKQYNKEKLVARIFSEVEKLAYFKEEKDKHAYFLKVWTQKEACYKYLSNRENGSSDYLKVSFFKLMGKEIANLLKQEGLVVDTFWVKKYVSVVSVVREEIN